MAIPLLDIFSYLPDPFKVKAIEGKWMVKAADGIPRIEIDEAKKVSIN